MKNTIKPLLKTGHKTLIPKDAIISVVKQYPGAPVEIMTYDYEIHSGGFTIFKTINPHPFKVCDSLEEIRSDIHGR